jgi:hypothetical protein
MKNSKILVALFGLFLLLVSATGFLMVHDEGSKPQEVEEETNSTTRSTNDSLTRGNNSKIGHLQNSEDLTEQKNNNRSLNANGKNGSQEMDEKNESEDKSSIHYENISKEDKSEVKEINVTRYYYLTPEKPQEVRVEVDYRLPSGEMPDVPNEYFEGDYEIIDSKGFEIKENGGSQTAIWNKETRNPKIQFKRFLENETVQYDNGNWSLLIPYQEPLGYSEKVNLDYEAEPGFIRIDSAIDRIFIGNFSVESQEFENHTFRLVIEDNSGFPWKKEKFFERMREVGNDLYVNHTLSNNSVVTGISVDDFKGGGGRVTGAILVETRKDYERMPYYALWTEEYVHMLQPITSDSMSFTTDGFAQYFTQYYHLKWGINNYTQFRKYTLGLTDYYSKDKQREVILTNSSTWFEDGKHLAGSKKVAVLAALDYRIHKATDGEKSLIDAYQKIPSRNSYPPKDYVTANEFKNIVEDITDQEFDKFFENYIRGQKYPEIPDDPELYMRTMDLANSAN